MKTKFSTKVVMPALSPLESDVLGMFLPDTEYKVQEIYERIKVKRNVAPTSVPVTLDRLHTKSLVKRRTETCRGGVRYIYSLKNSKSEYEKLIVEASVNKLLEKFGQSAWSYFNERFSSSKKVK